MFGSLVSFPFLMKRFLPLLPPSSAYSKRLSSTVFLIFFVLSFAPFSRAVHHMKRAPIHWVNQRDSARIFRVTNLCSDEIYPAIETQSGTGPPFGGFALVPLNSTNIPVSADWQGRIWGRTNCSFNADGTGPSNIGGIDGSGKACLTGDCGGVVDCKGSGQTPASLAEFTLETGSGKSFYDISLVDGYNIPIGILSLHNNSSDPTLSGILPNTTNPICIGSPNLLGARELLVNMTYSGMTYNMPLEHAVGLHEVESWCPWPLQLQPPKKPGDGVYPYPDDNIKRPAFDPCLSACSKYNKPHDCCTGGYNNPKICKPNLYSRSAKKICPDAYSYAFDDQSSTFTIKSGAGFEVVFCPYGRSTNIFQTVANLGYKDLAAAQQVTFSKSTQQKDKSLTARAASPGILNMSMRLGRSVPLVLLGSIVSSLVVYA